MLILPITWSSGYFVDMAVVLFYLGYIFVYYSNMCSCFILMSFLSYCEICFFGVVWLDLDLG
uniref:Uncharacterized protein n=1 Tax=Arundo donax TaxID=35708 RepID=A0A0A9HFI7_ARUDO